MNKCMKIALFAFAIVAAGQVFAMNQNYSPVEDELLVKTHERKMNERAYRTMWAKPVFHYNREMSRVWNAKRRLAAYYAGQIVPTGEIVPVDEVQVEGSTMPQTQSNWRSTMPQTQPQTQSNWRPTMPQTQPQTQSNWRPSMPQTEPNTSRPTMNQTPRTTSIPNMQEQTPVLGLPWIERPQVPADEPAFVPAPQEQPAAEPAQAPEQEKVSPRANLNGTNPRAILGVPATATKKEAIKAFRKLSVKYHPDQYATYRVELMQEGINTPEEGNEAFKKILAAYQVINDERE